MAGGGCGKHGVGGVNPPPPSGVICGRFDGILYEGG